MKLGTFYLVNTITIYRILAAPVLFALIFMGEMDIFKWLLPVSFFTDLIDGVLARRLRVTTKKGALLDSIGDELTVLAAIVAVIVFKADFVYNNILLVSITIGLYLLQTVLSLIRYRKLSSFHTYFAKIAAILQGTFLILIFFMEAPSYPLFYIATGVTILELSEEIILVLLLRNWETNVRGLYWVLKKRRMQDL